MSVVSKAERQAFADAVDDVLDRSDETMWDAIRLANLAGVDDPKRWHLAVCDDKLMADHRRLADRRGQAMMAIHPDVNRDHLTAVALSQMGYGASGVADVLEVSRGGAKRMLADAASKMGLMALETASPSNIALWPHAPVPTMGDRNKVVKWVFENTPQLDAQGWQVDGIYTDGDRHVTQSVDRYGRYELEHEWTNDRLVFRCPHGLVPSTKANQGQRRSYTRHAGVRIGVEHGDGTCGCVSPLTQLGYY
jgi:hypothetical protein